MRRRAIIAAAALMALPAAANADLNIETQASFSPATAPEIVDATPDETKLVATQGNQVGVWDITNKTAPVLRGLAPAVTTDVFNVSSVAVVNNRYALAAAQVDNVASGGAERDEVWVIDMQPTTPTLVRRIQVADWPDSIAVSPDKTFAAVAIENECEGLVRGPSASAPCENKTGGPTTTGSIEVLDISNADPAQWSVARSVPVPADPDLVDNTDVQPEFLDINASNKAAVTFQENNGVGILDLATGNWDDIWSTGSATFVTDVTDNGQLLFTTSLASSTREPDAIKWIAGGTRLITANEGEAANADNVDENPAVGGTRGYTIWAPNGALLADVNAGYERTIADFGLVSDDRSDNRGPEPEGMAVGTFDGAEYAFVNNERSRSVSMIDLTSLLNPRFVGLAPTGEEPEGVVVLPTSRKVITANEVGGEFTIAGLVDSTALPTTRPLVRGNDTPFFGATGLGTASDGALLFTSQQKPNMLNRTVTGTPGYAAFTQPVAVDTALATGVIQDVAANPGGGYWVVASGVSAGAHSGADLFRLSATGAVQSAVTLASNPTASGVAVSSDGGTVYVSSTAGSGNHTITKYVVSGAVESTFAVTQSAAPASSRIQDLAMRADGTLVAVEAVTPGSADSTKSAANILGVSSPGAASGTVTPTQIATVAAADMRAARSITGATVDPAGNIWTLNGTRSGRAGNTDLRRVVAVSAASSGSPGASGGSASGSSPTTAKPVVASAPRAGVACRVLRRTTRCTVTTRLPGMRIQVLRGSRIVQGGSSGSLGVATFTIQRRASAGRLRFLIDGRPLAIRFSTRA